MPTARFVFRSSLAALAVASALVTSLAQSEPRERAAPALEDAALAFDAGVKAFESADYVTAVRQFLRADAIVPNTDALWNALSAAHQAGNDALVATVAERAASREASAPKLAARAKQTLRKVESRVARLVLSCKPAPCELTLDGEARYAGTSYALPGNHVVAARGPDGSVAERSIEAVAAGEYTVLLELERSDGVPVASLPPAESRREEPPPRHHAPEQRDVERRPLPPVVFYTGVGITAALAAATTWSGIDALKAKERLPGSASDNDDVMSRAHRTDALLIGTLIAGAATAYAGLAWTDWDGPSSRLTVGGGLVRNGALLGIAGTH